MKYYVRLADDKKTICGASYSKEYDTIEVETEEEIEGIAFGGYQLIDGKVVKNVSKYNEYVARQRIDYLKEQGIRYLYLKYNASSQVSFPS